MAKVDRWTRDQLLIALRLYCCMPFGRLHNRNPEIIELANIIGRTPNALAMKACNLASLDPAQQARGIRGLSRASKADEALWEEFEYDAESVAAEAEAAFESLRESSSNDTAYLLTEPEGPTEVERTIRARRVQGFFRKAVLVSYENRCALTGICVPELLNASHIIPWSVSDQRRADPRNGICLNALHDRAFDRGLLTFDEDLRAVVSARLKVKDPPLLFNRFLLEIEGMKIQLPVRFQPDHAALEYHRDRIFQDG